MRIWRRAVRLQHTMLAQTLIILAGFAFDFLVGGLLGYYIDRYSTTGTGVTRFPYFTAIVCVLFVILSPAPLLTLGLIVLGTFAGVASATYSAG